MWACEWTVKSHRSSHFEVPLTWFNFILLLSYVLSFLNKEFHVFILHWTPQIMQLDLQLSTPFSAFSALLFYVLGLWFVLGKQWKWLWPTLTSHTVEEAAYHHIHLSLFFHIAQYFIHSMHSPCFSKYWMSSYYVQYSGLELVQSTKYTAAPALLDFIF